MARECDLERSKIQAVVGWSSDLVARRVPVALKERMEIPILGAASPGGVVLVGGVMAMFDKA